MERETGIEPATNSLEGCDSTTELLPPGFSIILAASRGAPGPHGRAGQDARITACVPLRLPGRLRAGQEARVTLHLMTDIPAVNGLIFAALGIVVFVIAFSLVVKLSPIDLWKQIGEGNAAAAILAGAVALGICWIIAATLH